MGTNLYLTNPVYYIWKQINSVSHTDTADQSLVNDAYSFCGMSLIVYSDLFLS